LGELNALLALKADGFQLLNWYHQQYHAVNSLSLAALQNFIHDTAI
jgi:hypothetical protein